MENMEAKNLPNGRALTTTTGNWIDEKSFIDERILEKWKLVG